MRLVSRPLEPSGRRPAQIRLFCRFFFSQLLRLTSITALSLSSLDQVLVFRLAVSRITNGSERGNQRERDRERAQARSGHKPKNPKDDGLTPEQRRERDAKALQEKMARKAAQGATGGNKNGDDVNKKKK